MAINTPLGTYVSDGIRTGPNFVDFQPGTTSPQINSAGVPSPALAVPPSANYTKFGSGVLHSSQITYTFSPAIADATDTAQDIGAYTPGVPTSDTVYTAWIPLKGNALSAKKYPNNYALSGFGASLQLDVPRCIQIAALITITDLTFDVNIYGTDLYGFPMMEYQSVSWIGDGATPTLFIADFNKAFFTIDSIQVRIPIPANASYSFSIQTTNIFGLPQRLYSAADIISISGGDQCLNLFVPAGTNTTPTTDPQPLALAVPGSPGTPPVNPINKYVAQGFFYNDMPLFATDPVSQSGTDVLTTQTGGPAHVANARDVRGTVDVSPLLNGYWSNPVSPRPIDNKTPQTFSITYIVRGADTGLNQLYAAKQEAQYLNGNIPNPQAVPNVIPILPNNYLTVALASSPYTPGALAQSTLPKLPLISIDEYGVPQFYQNTSILQ